jgi:NAD(P)-dependent dehydrogenase (short-subunit alcohol dehydrogenase family)
MKALEGKVVVVTGAGRGIGRAIALGAAAAGAKVVVADHGVTLAGTEATSTVADGVVAAIAEHGGEAVAVADTVTTMDGARRMVQAALDRWGRVDGTVCCAGILRHRPFLELSESDFDAVVETHLKGHFTVFRTAFEAMVEQGSGGSLIGISSGYLHGDALRASYRAAKAGVIALTKSVALAGADHAIRANVIAPMANTRMTEASNLRFDSDPEDIAPMAVYLLSDHAAGLTGEVFTVAGNSIATWRDPQEARTAKHWRRWEHGDIDAVMPWLVEGDVLPLTPPIGTPTPES